MTVQVHFEVDRPDWLDAADVVRAATAALAHGGRPGLPLSVVLVDDETLARMHGDLLGDPSPTDVMSFDLSDDEGEPSGGGDDMPLGEVVVSLDRAQEVASRRGVSPARETSLYVVHGVLHLCGWDDLEPEARARMREAERTVMRSLGFADDEAPHDEEGR